MTTPKTRSERIVAKNKAAFVAYLKKNGKSLADARAYLDQIDAAVASGDPVAVQDLGRSSLNNFLRSVGLRGVPFVVGALRSISTQSAKDVDQEDEQVALNAKAEADQAQAALEAKAARKAEYERMKALESEFK